MNTGTVHSSLTQFPVRTDGYLSDINCADDEIIEHIQIEGSNQDSDTAFIVSNSNDFENSFSCSAESSKDSSNNREVMLDLSVWIAQFKIPHAPVKDL